MGNGQQNENIPRAAAERRGPEAGRTGERRAPPLPPGAQHLLQGVVAPSLRVGISRATSQTETVVSKVEQG